MQRPQAKLLLSSADTKTSSGSPKVILSLDGSVFDRTKLGNGSWIGYVSRKQASSSSACLLDKERGRTGRAKLNFSSESTLSLWLVPLHRSRHRGSMTISSSDWHQPPCMISPPHSARIPWQALHNEKQISPRYNVPEETQSPIVHCTACVMS